MVSSLARTALVVWIATTVVPVSAQQPEGHPLVGSWVVTVSAFGEAKAQATGTLEVKANAEGLSVTLTVGSLEEAVRDASVGRGGLELKMIDHYFTGVLSDQELSNRLGIPLGTLVGTYVYAPSGKGDYKSGWRATRQTGDPDL